MFQDTTSLTEASAKSDEAARLSVAAPRSRRVLITGVGRFWGAQLARELEKDHAIDFVCGIDTREPLGEFGRTEVVRGDIRNPAIARLIDVTRVDTVVHTQIYGADRPGESSRLLHDMNVIGTMNLLAACSASPHVRKVIIRSSTAIYGASPKDPDYFTEDMESQTPLRDVYSRDIAEVEAYARDFSERSPQAALTILRFANSIGEWVDTPMTRYLGSQIVPTWAGYNPRLQFVADSDAIAALAHAVRVWRPGVFNIAGPGSITLGKFLRMAGRIPMPIIPPATGPVMSLLARTGLLWVPSRHNRLLRYGRGVSTDRMVSEFGFVPQYTTREAVERFAEFVRLKRYHERADEPLFDRELLEYVQGKVQQMPALGQDIFSRLTPFPEPEGAPPEKPPADSRSRTMAGARAKATATRTAKVKAKAKAKPRRGRPDDDHSS